MQALVNGVLIDGTGAEAVPDAVLLIQGKTILAVSTRQTVKIPNGAQVIDVQGGTILPGFFNAHVHGAYDEDNLETWARQGVTTVRDLGTNKNYAPKLAFRNEHRDLVKYARLVAAGAMITVPDGYPIVPWGMTALTVTTAEEARQTVNQLLEDGADIIKIPLESGVTFQRVMPKLSPEEAKAIVEVVHQHGTRVSVHLLAPEDIESALAAGVDDLAHMVVGNPADELLQRVAEAGLVWVPTLELWNGVGYGNDAVAIRNLRRYVTTGGKVALGTDYGGYSTPFQLGMPVKEAHLMQQAGMTPMQIITAATQNAAYVCNLEKVLGTLEAGKIADVLVVAGDPLADLNALAQTALVVHGGVVIVNNLDH